MQFTATLTQKGQVTIPISIRKKLGLKPYKQVTFVSNGDKVVLKPTKTFYSLKGSISTSKQFNDKKADQNLLNFKKREYEKKLRNS